VFQKINNLPILFKLSLMLLPPMVALVGLATQSALHERAELVEVEQVVERVSFSSLLDAVAHNFAVERGLTAGFLASGGNSNREKLGPQRKMADSQVILLESALQQAEVMQFGAVVTRQLQQLMELLQQRTTVRAAVDQLRTEPKAFDFYSKINAMALELIEELASGVTDANAARQLNTWVALLWMKERAGQERGALNAVFTRGELSSQQKRAIIEYITDQELKQKSFLRNATADQRTLYQQQLESKVVDAVLSRRMLLQSREEKLDLLGQLKAEMGYGGLIHNFKNYVLRGSEKYKQRVEMGYQRVRTIIERFHTIKGITAEESEWLSQVAQVMEQYHQGAQQVAAIFAKNGDSRAVDQTVKVDDSPALKALQGLGKLSGMDAGEWFKVATARISRIKIVAQQVSDETVLDSQMRLKEIERQFVILVASIMLLLGVVLWVGIVVGRGILNNVRQTAEAIQQIEQSGDFSTRVKVLSRDEVGAMATALNTLLEQLQLSIGESNRVVGQVAQGDFEHRVELELQGDLAMLKSGINGSADSVERTMTALAKVMKGLSEGDLSVRMSDDVEPLFRDQVNHAMASMDRIVRQIGEVISSLAEGDFAQRMSVEAKGDLEQLKKNINLSMVSLEQAVEETASTANRMGEGDLTRSISGRYQGRLAVMKDAINATQTNLSYIVDQVRSSAESVESGSNKISKGNQDLSSRTNEQAASLEETASSMEQITATVKLNAESADNASQLVSGAAQEAVEGSRIVEQAMEAMERISESSGKISDIISLIDGIAFQTNLLALNAAVEAARAGEQGRGFAVVAGEVRTLAQRSAEAAKEIKGLIDTTTERVTEGSELVNQSGEALNRIQGSVNKVTSVASEIAEAAREQTRGIEQINTAISQLDNVNQGNAALVEQAAASSTALSEQAKGLTSVVSTFKLNPQTASVAREQSSFNEAIAGARTAHLAWKGKIRGFLDGMIEMDEKEAISHHDCVLGKWLDSEGREKYRHLEAMGILDRVHEKLHRVIRDIIHSKNSGETDKVEQLYGEIDPISKEVLLQLDKIEAASHRPAQQSNKRPVAAVEKVRAVAKSVQKTPVQRKAAPVAGDSEWSEF